VSPFPRTAKALREAMDAAGLAPRKRHGQCFLTDVQAVDAIVRDAGIAPGDAVVEVGTGTGLLTHALTEAGAAVETFDLDAEVQSFARGLRDWPARVVFHAEDALEGKHRLSAPLLAALARARAAGPGRAKFVSNLPYNAATPVLLALLALEDPPDEITSMVQLEVAEKLLARPGDEDYGPPSILRALTADGRILRRFPPQVFWPQPTVRSALLRLVPRRPPGVAPAEERAFGDFLLALFSRRRKVLSTALRSARPALSAEAASRALAAVGLDPRARPEDAEPERLVALFRSHASAGRAAG
jgi:16S rRNA (adenine1518-N6/adenine1519-N6)-dimethyltransferase